MFKMPKESPKEVPNTPLTPPPTPDSVVPPTPKRARKSPPKKLVPLDDPEMPPLREIIPATKALVSPPIIQQSPKRGKILLTNK